MREEDIFLKLIAEDKVNVNEEGFHWKNHGRTAMIYFVENTSIVPIEAEMPGVEYLDILVYGETEHIKHRYFVDEDKWEVISIKDRVRIQDLLVQWLNSKGWRHGLYIRN